MNRFFKISAWIFGAILVAGLFFSDNIWGYFRFRKICEGQSGLRVYERLQKGVGWSTSRRVYAEYLLTYYGGINSVRYLDGNPPQDLVRTTEKKAQWDSGFRPRLVDASQPTYFYTEELEKVPKDARMNRYTSTVTNIQSGATAATYQDFTYRLFNPDWGTGGGFACSALNRRDLNKVPNDSKEVAFQTAFIN